MWPRLLRIASRRDMLKGMGSRRLFSGESVHLLEQVVGFLGLLLIEGGYGESGMDQNPVAHLRVRNERDEDVGAVSVEGDSCASLR